MLHLTLAHYYEIMSCHLQTEVVVYPIVYKCLQVGCHLGFKTIPALLSHEQMKHRAFEKFIGTIIGRNDLFKELHWWVRNLFLGNIGGENGDKAWPKSSSTVTNLLLGALYGHANWIDQSRRTGSSSKPLKAEASISFKAKGGLTKSRPIALAAAETKEVWFRWPLMRFFCFFQASHCFKILLKNSHDRMYQLFWHHKSENIRKIVKLK